MRLSLGRLITVVLVVWVALLAWRFERIPALPPRPLADVGAVKQDLLNFARAERVFFASSGHYAPMHELRDRGLLTLPPESRWPYVYYVFMPEPQRFYVVAMAQGPLMGRPLALAVDENMDMRELHPRDVPGPHRHRTRQKALRMT